METRVYRVVSAAMLMNDGLVVPGVRHFSPDMRLVLERIYGRGLKLWKWWVVLPYWLRVREQGFIDTHGNFLPRNVAWVHADNNGQICLFDPTGDNRIQVPAKKGTQGMLFSENLY